MQSLSSVMSNSLHASYTSFLLPGGWGQLLGWKQTSTEASPPAITKSSSTCILLSWVAKTLYLLHAHLLLLILQVPLLSEMLCPFLCEEAKSFSLDACAIMSFTHWETVWICGSQKQMHLGSRDMRTMSSPKSLKPLENSDVKWKHSYLGVLL